LKVEKPEFDYRLAEWWGKKGNSHKELTFFGLTYRKNGVAIFKMKCHLKNSLKNTKYFKLYLQSLILQICPEFL
jgi:hypothetical protein